MRAMLLPLAVIEPPTGLPRPLPRAACQAHLSPLTIAMRVRVWSPPVSFFLGGMVPRMPYSPGPPGGCRLPSGDCAAAAGAAGTHSSQQVVEAPEMDFQKEWGGRRAPIHAAAA
jgi:hypothetical protein